MTATLFLVGAPGAGKSTVGALLAARLGVPFVDVDAVIESRVGKSVAEIFADDGEAVFRAFEESTTLELLDTPGVLSLGGGAVLSPITRAALAGREVVWLEVSPGEAARRVGLNEARPLLLGNVRGRLIKLLAERTPLYAEVASRRITTDARSPEDVATEVLGAPMSIEVRAERPYDVVVGFGVLDRLPDLLVGARRVALIHPPTVIGAATRAARLLSGADCEVIRIDVPDAEAAKTVEVAASCWSVLGRAGFTRSDAVVGLGGGATTDLAGFVAATWLRGVSLVTVPTSLLGMVDAAVGGKTGINTAEGKNLVGCFYEPRGVLCDLGLLATLPPAELTGGLAEIIKCGFIADPDILTLVEDDPAAVKDPASRVLSELVERSIRVKAAAVSADLRESTSVGSAVGRELLNYGHTLGHAIERREHYRVRHGEAISVGMVFVAELARLAGRLETSVAARHAEVLDLVGLPTTYAADAFDDLHAAMHVDKKARGATLRFVILTGPARAEILVGPPEDLLRAAYAAVAS